MYFERFFDLDEIIEKVEAVSAEDVSELSRQMFRPETTAVTVLGNLDGMKLPKAALAF
jgi:predicted Zn-dependent peptidase